MTRLFRLVRDEDMSGVSGTGVVADGVVFDDGRTVLRWRAGHARTRGISIFDSLVEVEAVHGHEGRTRIVFGGERPERVLTLLSSGG